MARVKVVKWTDKPHEKKKMKKRKVKRIKKKEKPKMNSIQIGPKLRLEPRLSPIKSPKITKDVNDNEHSIEKTDNQPICQSQNSGNFVSSTVSCEGIILPDTIKFEFESGDVYPEISGTSGDNTYRTVRNKIDFLKSHVTTPSVTPSSSRVQWKPRLRLKSKMRKGRYWHDRELLNLATGLQTYGFNDIKKIAELVKTKNENQIRDYIRLHSVDVRAEVNAKNSMVTETQTDGETDTDAEAHKGAKKHKGKPKNSTVRQKGRPTNKWSKVSPEHLSTWPNVRKWRRLAFDQMLAFSRAKDYSKTVIASLMERFFDEEEDPSDPQVINVKAVYKYLMDCLAGEIPAQLPPKESALVMDLLRDLRLLPLVYDFDEETKFLESYKEATRYKPFEVKEEFKKRFVKIENLDDGFNLNCVSVPEEVFTNLSRHKRVVQNFNPLMIPVWMMQKEQEYMDQFV